MAMTQGEAVFQAVNEVVGGVEGKVELSDSQLDQVHQLVFQMFKSGATSHSKNPSDEQLLKYIPGLVNNWLRKDLRLNGGEKYQTKRPGSRTGSGDEGIRAMRTLLSLTQDEKVKAQIQAEIDKRIAELKPTPTVDASKLPESLRHLVK